MQCEIDGATLFFRPRATISRFCNQHYLKLFSRLILWAIDAKKELSLSFQSEDKCDRNDSQTPQLCVDQVILADGLLKCR